MTAQIRNGTEVIAEADDRNGALTVYKHLNPTHLVYPKDPEPILASNDEGEDMMRPGPVSEVHVRIPDDNGEYPTVVVLTLEEMS